MNGVRSRGWIGARSSGARSADPGRPLAAVHPAELFRRGTGRQQLSPPALSPAGGTLLVMPAHARRLLVLLAALTVFVLASASSALAAAGPQNCTWAQNPASQADTGLKAAESPCSRPGSTLPDSQIASGFYVAAEDGVTVASGAGGMKLPFTELRPVGADENFDELLNELKVRTWDSGNEHALVQTADGGRVIGSGGPGGVTNIDGEVLAHTHPDGSGPSDEDIAAAAGQTNGMWVLPIFGGPTFLPGGGG